MSRRYSTSYLWRVPTYFGKLRCGYLGSCLRSPYVAINPEKNLQYSLALFPDGIPGTPQEHTVCLLINLNRHNFQSTGKPAYNGSIAAQFDINISNGDFSRKASHTYTSDSKVLIVELSHILDEHIYCIPCMRCFIEDREFIFNRIYKILSFNIA